MALGLVLVVGAGLVVQSFRALAAAHPGFDPRDTLTARVSTPPGPHVRQSRGRPGLSRRRAAAARGAARGRRRSARSASCRSPGRARCSRTPTTPRPRATGSSCRPTASPITPGYFDAVRRDAARRPRLHVDEEIASGRRVIVIDDSLARSRVRRRGEGRRQAAAARAGRRARELLRSRRRRRAHALSRPAPRRSCRRSIAAASSGRSAWRFGPTATRRALAEPARAALAGPAARHRRAGRPSARRPRGRRARADAGGGVADDRRSGCSR